MNAAKKKYVQAGKKSRGLWLAFLFLIVLPFLAGAVFLSRFDLNTYRPQIAQEATKALGREVVLHGPLSFSLSFARGLSLEAQDVTLANPAWASRPVMAKVGRMYVHVDLTKLLAEKLDIVAFDLEKADILLETKADGTNNWTFKKAAEPAPKTKESASTGSSVSINVREAAITDSRFGMLGKDGKLTIFDVPRLSFKENGRGITASFTGTVAGVATSFDLTGGALADISGANWPFTLEAKYGALNLEAKGKVSDGLKRIALPEVRLTAGASDIEGALTVTLGGARPAVAGNLKARKLDPADFAMGGDQPAAGKVAEKKGGKIFSRDPLPLDGLRSADLDLMITVDELAAGVVPVKNVILPVKLTAGRLDVAPFSGVLGGNKASGKLGLDASQATARVAFAFAAKDADMAQLLSLWGLESIINGKADVAVDLTASGRSSYDLASTSNGTINLLMDAGQVSSGVAKEMAAGLLDLFAPGAGGLTKPGVNCVAGRYTVTNGLVQTKGLLIDTEVTTLSGLGTINLPDERISMSLYTRPKALGLTAALPPMKIYGDLASPSYNFDASAVAEKVVGLLTNSSTGAGVVPTLIKVPAGVNACAATLDNPAAAQAAENARDGKKTLLPSTGTLQDKIKGVGDKLLRGLGTGLMGQ